MPQRRHTESGVATAGADEGRGWTGRLDGAGRFPTLPFEVPLLLLRPVLPLPFDGALGLGGATREVPLSR